MATVEFVQATRRYPGTRRPALDRLDLAVASGEFVVLLGADASGKSTALRLLAGLEPADAGTVLIDGADVTGLGPAQRDIAMVFQGYALHPTTVGENLGFRLEAAGLPHSSIARRVRRQAGRLELAPMLERDPHPPSGGEAQRGPAGRAIVGRAITREPRVYLMDEPLSSLDAKPRAEMRGQIAALQRRLGTTMLYATQDQSEATTLGDRIAVLRDGILLQCDAPRALYDNPSDAYVAAFIGSPPMNLLTADVEQGWAILGDINVIELPLGRHTAAALPGTEVTVGFRPEAAALAPPGTGLHARIEAIENLGYTNHVHCDTGLGLRRREVIVRCEPGTAARPGTAVGITLDPTAIHYFHPTTGRRLHASD